MRENSLEKVTSELGLKGKITRHSEQRNDKNKSTKVGNHYVKMIHGKFEVKPKTLASDIQWPQASDPSLPFQTSISVKVLFKSRNHSKCLI